jgi:hypothetical protein
MIVRQARNADFGSLRSPKCLRHFANTQSVIYYHSKEDKNMNSQKAIWIIVGCVIFGIGIIAIFIFWALPLIDSAAVAGIIGVLVGSFAGLLGSIVTSIVGIWRVTKDAEERLKDRISNHALELTRMDYELRQKSLDSRGTKQLFLAPAKAYRTFYRALLDLHTTGNWPKEVEELGLLNIFELGPKRNQQDKEVS